MLAAADRPVIKRGDWVKVVPRKPYLAAHGPVVRVTGDGIDVLDFTAGRGNSTVLKVQWQFVAAVERAEPRPVIERTYTGDTLENARRASVAEATALAAAGYRSSSLAFDRGDWPWLVRIGDAALMPRRVGTFIRLVMTASKPNGTLTVRYARPESAAAAAAAMSAGTAERAANDRPSRDDDTLDVVEPPPPAGHRLPLVDHLAQLAMARHAGLLAESEYQRRRTDAIARH